MAQKIRGFWFRLCGFFVGVFGALFGNVHNAKADVVAPSDCYSSITGQQIASVPGYSQCETHGSHLQCRKLISASEYNTIMSRGNNNVDTYYDSIYYSIGGGTECDTSRSYAQDGVQYYKCEGNRQWCAEANDNKQRNGTDVDRYLDNYGYTYTAMFRIIGCSNGRLAGAMVGDTVASLNGVECVVEECPHVDDDNLLNLQYSMRGECYIDMNEIEEHNLYDATGHFYYKQPSTEMGNTCYCFENNYTVCS